MRKGYFEKVSLASIFVSTTILYNTHKNSLKDIVSNHNTPTLQTKLAPTMDELQRCLSQIQSEARKAGA